MYNFNYTLEQAGVAGHFHVMGGSSVIHKV